MLASLKLRSTATMPANPAPITEKEVQSALTEYNAHFSKEAPASLISIRGRIIEVRIGGNIWRSCCAEDYFDDLSSALEALAGAPYAPWDYSMEDRQDPHYTVRYAKLDFLGEIRDTIEKVGDQIQARMAEFRAAGGDEKRLFSELCYCILTANYTAEGGMHIQNEIGEGFTVLPRDALAVRLRGLHYRFPNTRAGYIFEARCHCGSLLETLKGFASQAAAREWLVENVKGYGHKEASHFLRNVGFTDVAIIDRHIIHFLAGKGLIDDPKKALTRSRYIIYERILAAIARKLGVTLAELDLYIWYMMTGKVLK